MTLSQRRDEVLHELRLGVVARVDLGERAQLGVQAGAEVGTGASPLDLARGVVASLEGGRVLGRRRPRRAQVEQVDEEVVGQRSGGRGEDTVGRLLVVGAQDAQATDEDRQLGSAQGQQVRAVQQQVLGREAVALAEVVAEPVGGRLQRGEGLHVGVLLRRVDAARGEGHLDVVTGVLGGLLDRGAAAEHDQVGQGDLLGTGVELPLDALQRAQRRELVGVVGLPAALRLQADARAVGAAALVAAAERRGRRPGGGDQLRDGRDPSRGSSP